MNETDQRIAIAKACGWSHIINKSTIQIGGLWMGYPPVNPIIGTLEHVPDYLNDLNAMHEAQKVLDDDQYFEFEDLLIERCIRPPIATAAQRAEAFLRTLNLWKEDK